MIVFIWPMNCLFVWFDSLRPINNLSVIKGWIFLGWTSTKLGLFDTWKPITVFSTLDKQRICVNTQWKSSKKQLKWNVCVPKSNSNNRYAITWDVIAYHLVHFVSIWVINKCQSGIDFIFTSERAILLQLWIKYWCPVQYFAENTMMKVELCKV